MFSHANERLLTRLQCDKTEHNAGGQGQARPVSAAREQRRKNQTQQKKPVPPQSQQHRASIQGNVVQSLVPETYEADDLAFPDPGSSQISRHNRSNKAGSAAPVPSISKNLEQERSESAMDHVLNACSAGLSAEPSHDSVAQAAQQESQQNGFVQASSTEQYTNVLFQLPQSAGTADPNSSHSASALDYEHSALTMEVSRTIAGSLCIPYEPTSLTNTDSSLMGSQVGKQTGTSSLRKSLGLRWTDKALAATNSWETEATEESMQHLVVKGNDTTRPPKAERSRPSVTIKDDVFSHDDEDEEPAWRPKAMNRDWTRSKSKVFTMQAQQQASAMRRYNKRILQMYRLSMTSRDSMDIDLSSLKPTILVPGNKGRHRVPVAQKPLDKQPGSDSQLGMRVDPSVELALATNPLIGILAQSHPKNEDEEVLRLETNLKLPDGMCLLSPFCLLEDASRAATRPEKDSDDVDIPEVVLGMDTSHPIRRVFITVTLHSTFDTFMTAAIMVSCGSMVFERPSLPVDSAMAQYLKTSNLVLTVIFGTIYQSLHRLQTC